MRSNQAIQPLLTWLASRGPLVLAGLGALLLLVAEFLTLYEVVAITAVVPGGTQRTGTNHLFALALIALVSLPMAWGAAVGGSRPAAFALTALGLAALFVVLAIDLPVVNDEGLLAETFESAKASPQEGFWVELVGALVLLGAGVSAVVLGPGAGEEPRRRGARASDAEPEPEPEQEPERINR